MGILIVWILLCVGIAIWAQNKGRSAFGFFCLAFFLSPLVGGLVVAMVKPNRKIAEAQAIQTGDVRKCPFCAELVKSEAVLCRYCGKDLPPMPIVDARPRNIDGVVIG